MDRQQRFGEAFAEQRSLVDRRREQAELVVQSYREAGFAASDTLGLHVGRDNVNEREEFTRMVFEQQALRYAPVDDYEDGSSSSLSGGSNVGGLDVRSESSAPSDHERMDFSEFNDAPPLYRARPYEHMPNPRGGLVPYDTTSVESHSVNSPDGSLSSHSTGYIPPRPPRNLPPRVQSPESVHSQRFSPAPSVHGSIAGSQRLSPAVSAHESLAGSQRPSPVPSAHGSIASSIGSAFDQALVPGGSTAPKPAFVSTFPTPQVTQPAANPSAAPKQPKKKTLKVSTYSKTGPPKIKISRPTWPPPGHLVIDFDPRTQITEPKAPKSRNYTPAFRNIDELIKQDNRCARLYGLLHDLDDDYECNISAEDVPRVIEWSGFAFPPQLTRIITEQFRYEKPRKVQTVVAPLLLAGYDVVCRMENASGKTMAYILPMFTILHDRINAGQYKNDYNDMSSHPFALIIADTRELTTQIYEQICKCNLAFGYKVSRCIGEFDRRINIQELQGGADIIVATPGRLRDVVESGYLNVSDLQYIVFDEADRIFSPGFWDQLNPVFQRFPELNQRQMSFFGATIDTNLDLGQFLRPGYATVANLKYKIAPRLNFYFCFVNRRTRYSTFLTNYAENIIKDNPLYSSKILIFMRTIDECNQMRDFMQQNLKTCQVLAMNSSRNQFQRDAIIKELRNPAPVDHLIVLTTNLMCRGLDIPEVNHVVHFSIDEFDDFVNRSGRTGRLCDGYVHVLIDKDASIPNVKMVRQALLSIKHDIPPEIDLFIASKFNEIDFV
uniref:ATP-dependent RNA helicase n=1 Tax=Panagrellus redivivus TaxID=6233 RepID=A0A7E4VZ88_PANRE